MLNPPMRALKSQYFLSYAVMGCVVPFISLFFRDIGLGNTLIGYIMALSSLAMVISPVIVTFLADSRLDPRRIMAVALTLCAAALLAMLLTRSFAWVFFTYGLYTLLFVSVAPLQDGVNFSIQQRRREAGQPPVDFHHIRVWGSIGYIVPSFLLFWLFRHGFPIESIIPAGAAVALLATLSSFVLPNPKPVEPQASAPQPPGAASMPTLAAAKILLGRPLLVFCTAIFLIQMAMASYYTFYPLYLTERVGIDKQWVGLISTIGVVVEIGFMLCFGRIIRALGLRNLMLIGVACMVLRLVLLAAFPTAPVAIGQQLLHGIHVLVLLVAPPVFLNQHADDRYRHSLQGLFAMIMVGVARSIGSLIAGPIAHWSLTGVYWYAAGVCAAALLLLFAAFHEAQAPQPAPAAREQQAGIADAAEPPAITQPASS